MRVWCLGAQDFPRAQDPEEAEMRRMSLRSKYRFPMQGLDAHTALHNHQDHISVATGRHRDVTKVLSVCCIPLFANPCTALASSILRASSSRYDARVHIIFISARSSLSPYPNSDIFSYVADLLDHNKILRYRRSCCR